MELVVLSVVVASFGADVVLVDMSFDTLFVVSLPSVLPAGSLGGTLGAVVWAMTATGKAAAMSQRNVLVMIFVRLLVGQGATDPC